MRRKPAIILLSFLLLLSIGGAVFYHHMRKDKPPTFTEVDRFMRRIPELTGCAFRDHIAEPPRVIERYGWWSHLGIKRGLEVCRETYTFENLQYGTYAKIAVSHHGESIIRFQVTGNCDVDGLMEFILLRYPKLHESHLMFQ